ncbi:MAG: nuclear transport factor 2 family protein [Pseudomonadota bacterium]
MSAVRIDQLLLATVAIAVFSGALFAQESAAERDCLALERDRYSAMIDVDIYRLADMLDDGLVFIHASGRTDTRTSFLDRLAAGTLTYKSIDLVEPKARAFDGVCIVSGQSNLSIVVGENARDLSLLFTSVWVRNANNWQVAAYQSTRAP